MKTTKSQFAQIEKYIFDCIDFQGYEFKETSDKKELLSNLIETFKIEFWHDYNQKYYKGDIKIGFENWLLGLPSSFNVDFENYRILEIGGDWGFDLSSETKEDKFISQWFQMISNSVFYLYNKK